MADSAVRVIGGDGLPLEGGTIRVWGIDAPELGQICEIAGRETPCGEDARFLLGALVQGGDLVCEVRDIERYVRSVARSFWREQAPFGVSAEVLERVRHT